MFLILSIDIGGAPVLPTFARLWGESGARFASEQFSYAFTEGLRLCFIAMPMFLFIVGVVIPLSLKQRLSRTPDGQKRLYFQIVRRTAILFLLGLVAGGHLLSFDLTTLRLYNNVLEYIAVSYLLCAILVLNTKVSFQLVLASVLLVGYWLLFLFIPVPGGDGERFSGEMNLAVYIDNLVLGPFHGVGSWQVLATINFVANVLLGVLMGHILNLALDKRHKTRLLAMGGLSMLLLGLVWGFFFPIIRNLWTSSFVLVTCGMTALLLAAFYWVIDVLGHGRWAFFFIVFGVNSIAVYMMAHLFDFRLIGNIFVGGISRFLPPSVQEFVKALAAMMVMWWILFWMYRKKTFVKV